MIMSEELMYNQLYERTKDFGRTQFIKELMNLERQNKDLQQRIKKTIELLDDLYFGNFFSNEKPTKFIESKVGDELLSILKGKDVK